MSRSRLPPTPSMSGGFIVKDQVAVDGSDLFVLPPAAISPAKANSTSRQQTSKSEPSVYFPASPTSPRLDPEHNANPPQQTTFKRPLEDFDLPPPPTRTRKIIQMKPKTQSSPKPTAAASKSSNKGTAKGTTTNAAPAASKKKQPSATSAAGRKIARKTAHSLIERRRRSKMNEEFATLKNMIPACRGQDMHKLAILQASIDYVNYLEKCIQDLKTAGDQPKKTPPSMPSAPLSPTSPEVFSDMKHDTFSISASPQLVPNGVATENTSPMFSPRSRMPSMSTAADIPPSVLPSPALGPIYHGERTFSSTHSSWAFPSSAKTSPTIQPRFSNASSADMDHEASAALLMLNRDCRGSIDSGHGGSSSSTTREDSQLKQDNEQRKKRMSVMDLLIS